MTYTLLQEMMLLERNIANQAEIKKFITALQTRANTDVGKKWLKSNLRNWIINSYKDVAPARITKKSPEWLVSAVSKGEKVFDVQFSDRFRQEMEHVVDYLNNLESERVSRISVPQAIKQAEEWTKRLIKAGSKVKEEESGTTTMLSFKDGSRIALLKTDPVFKREGSLMGHCVGSYCSGFKEGKYEIYSLRDTQNEPHATIEINGSGKLNGREIRQIKGKQNRAPIRKYWSFIWDFVAKYNLKIEYDYENIGFYKIKGKLYPYTRLPKGASISGTLDLSKLSGFTLPEGLQVGGDLDLHGTDVVGLPKGLKVTGSLYMSNTRIMSLPTNLHVGEDLILVNTPVSKLPKGLEVGDDLVITNTRISLTEEQIQKTAKIGGDIIGTGEYEVGAGYHKGHWVDEPLPQPT